MSLADRIKNSRKEAGITQAEVARVVGVSRATVSLWESGEIKSLEGSNLIALARLLRVGAGWLATGKGERNPMVKEVPAPALAHIPIVGTTQAGPDAHWQELGYPVGYGDEYVAMPRPDPTSYALRVRGGSMGGRIKDGEAIVVSPTLDPLPGEEVVVKTIDGQVMVKLLAWRRNGEVALDSVANGFDRIVLKDADIEFIHPVVGIVPASRIRQR